MEPSDAKVDRNRGRLESFLRGRWSSRRLECHRTHQQTRTRLSRFCRIEDLSFVTEGKIVRRESDDQVLPVTSDFIRSLRGCLKGEDSLVEA